MPQLFVEPGDITGTHFQLHGAEAHHVIRVLRCQPNDTLQLFDGTGQQYKGQLTHVDVANAVVKGNILEKLSIDLSQHHIRLFQGLPKGAKFDFIVEKAVELGVDEILPYLSQKSVIDLTPEQAQKKTDRWTRLAKAAAKQCNRQTIPFIAAPVNLTELGSQMNKGITYLFTEEARSRSFGDVLRSSKSSLPQAARINMIIGPESGLSSKELDWLVGLGAQPVSLGKLTLRTETAGLAAVSILRYELGLL